MRWIAIRKGWWFSAFLIALFLSIPLLYVLVHLFAPGSEAWTHIKENLLPDYALNSLLLCLSVGALSLIFGVSSAWLVSMFNFPGRRIFQVGLYLPLAVPAYIMAFTYSGIFDFTGVYQTTLRSLFSADTSSAFYFDIMQMKYLVVILASAYFPYIFATTRAVFRLQAANYLETARSLGLSMAQSFRRVAIPLARPAIAGGLFLVLMEVLSDYGAVKYFGVTTFTTGIFKAWFGFGDLGAAIKLSGFLIVFVLIVVGVEKLMAGKAKFHFGSQPRQVKRIQLKGRQALGAFIVCLIPFAIGFLIPFAQLLTWAFKTFANVFDQSFILLMLNSILVAVSAALLIIAIAVIIIWAVRINHNGKSRWLKRIATSGYAIPGAIIAVGVLVPSTGLDNWIIKAFPNAGLILTGSLVLLIFAYLVRFFAVGHNPIEGGIAKNPESIEESVLSIGRSSWSALRRIHLPLLKPALIAAFVLTFVDVMKELPLTLILRPANFDTLATKSFELANDEMLRNAATPAVILILISAIPIFLLEGKKDTA